jgi:transcriptional regulator GlxA family with amidase domain
MNKVESLEEFYQRKFGWMPDKMRKEIGHFNIFRLEPFVEGKPTTQIISKRILQESQVLLKHTAWNVSEIAYSPSFKEVTHFNNFFKKHVQQSPFNIQKPINFIEKYPIYAETIFKYSLCKNND